jgi:hypothetical protein
LFGVYVWIAGWIGRGVGEGDGRVSGVGVELRLTGCLWQRLGCLR